MTMSRGQAAQFCLVFTLRKELCVRVMNTASEETNR